MDIASFAFIPNVGFTELMVILVIGVLLFGKRLPEVGRSLGKGIVEFKKGLRGMEEEVDEASRRPDRSERAEPSRAEREEVEDSPRFEVPPQKK